MVYSEGVFLNALSVQLSYAFFGAMAPSPQLSRGPSSGTSAGVSSRLVDYTADLLHGSFPMDPKKWCATEHDASDMISAGFAPLRAAPSETRHNYSGHYNYAFGLYLDLTVYPRHQICNMIVLTKFLREFQSPARRYDIVVVYPMGYEAEINTHSIESFNELGVRLQPVSLAMVKGPKNTYFNSFLKLRVGQLNEYDQIIYLDSDIMPLGNVDHLFDIELGPSGIAAPEAYWLKKETAPKLSRKAALSERMAVPSARGKLMSGIMVMDPHRCTGRAGSPI